MQVDTADGSTEVDEHRVASEYPAEPSVEHDDGVMVSDCFANRTDEWTRQLDLFQGELLRHKNECISAWFRPMPINRRTPSTRLVNRG